MIEIKSLDPNEVTEITFGPYVKNNQGKYTHLYQVVFKKDKDDIYPIGRKFGFVCDVMIKLPVKSMKNKVFEKVQELKGFTFC